MFNMLSVNSIAKYIYSNIIINRLSCFVYIVNVANYGRILYYNRYGREWLDDRQRRLTEKRASPIYELPPVNTFKRSSNNEKKYHLGR